MLTSVELIIDQCLKQKMDISWNYTPLRKKSYLTAQKKNKINENKKNGENIASLKVVKVVYSNLIQQKININKCLQYYVKLEEK